MWKEEFKLAIVTDACCISGRPHSTKKRCGERDPPLFKMWMCSIIFLCVIVFGRNNFPSFLGWFVSICINPPLDSISIFCEGDGKRRVVCVYISNVTLWHSITHTQAYIDCHTKKTPLLTHFISFVLFSFVWCIVSLTSYPIRSVRAFSNIRHMGSERAYIFTSNVNGNPSVSVRSIARGIQVYVFTKIRYLHRIYLPLLLKIPSVYNTMKRKETNQIEQKKGCETPNRIEMKGTEQKGKAKKDDELKRKIHQNCYTFSK